LESGAAPEVGLALAQRELGRIVGARAGPTLVAIAGVHGNERAGVEAARRVLAGIDETSIELCGELVVLAGNLASLRRGVRYQFKDLNRVWTESRLLELANEPAAARDAEDNEQLELVSAIEAARARARGPLHLADLHTTSAAGIPFVLFGDTLAQRDFVQVFPIPILFGLEEQIDGAITTFWTRRGFNTFAVEGGQHLDPTTVESLEAVLWLTLARAGLIDKGRPEVLQGRTLLEQRRAGAPRVAEVIARRAITPEDQFRMAPGFRNIDAARKGQLLAHDKSGELRAPSDGLVIMPLYQGLGGDGFFWGREVSPLRLKISGALRNRGLERLLALLPGVARDPDSPSRFLVNTRVARLYPLEVFHLLGYRRLRKQGHQLTVERSEG